MPQHRLADLIALSDKIEIPVFIVEVGSDGDLMFRKINRVHEHATGIKNDDLAGKRPHDILPERMADGLVAKYTRCVESKASYSYEELLDLPKGQLWWQTTLSPIFFDDGRVIGIFGTAVEITAHKQKEFSDAQTISQLKQLNDEVNMYTSMAAHDVRGPLRKIQVMSELVFDDTNTNFDGGTTIDSMQRGLIEDIGAVAAKTLQHVDSILSYSRALALDSQPTLETVDVGMLCTDLIGVFDPQSAINFDHTHAAVHAERIVLQVVLRNLLDNAVRYCRSACRVDLAVDEDKPEMLRITVSDDGKGFENESVFQREEARSAMKSATRGFGLDGAQRMIEARGCHIWLAQPHFGRGASVAFTLPGRLEPDELPS